MEWERLRVESLGRRISEAKRGFAHESDEFLKFPKFWLAKGAQVPSLPLPCLESLEKQRHGKPLPSVSKSLELGRSFVANKVHATCFNARTASGNAGWAKRASFPMLTLETSGRIFLFPVD
jgi:hypothetical protein